MLSWWEGPDSWDNFEGEQIYILSLFNLYPQGNRKFFTNKSSSTDFHPKKILSYEEKGCSALEKKNIDFPMERNIQIGRRTNKGARTGTSTGHTANQIGFRIRFRNTGYNVLLRPVLRIPPHRASRPWTASSKFVLFRDRINLKPSLLARFSKCSLVCGALSSIINLSHYTIATGKRIKSRTGILEF